MGQVFFLVIALAAIVFFFLITLILKNTRSHSFNKEEYQTRWLKIENGLHKNDPRTYQLSVLEGDKLLDHAMKELGVPGKSMGERLKKVGSRFSDLNRVWYAHKIRNQLAHEEGFSIDYNTASRALAAFRQALKDLGAI